MSQFYAHPETLIQEAIELSVIRKFMKTWPTGNVAAVRKQLFANLSGLPSATRSRNKYRVYLPYDVSQTEQEIRAALEGSGYEIKSYAEGQATDTRGRTIGLGKVFSILKRPDLELRYSRDGLARHLPTVNNNRETRLVFSYHPYDIVGMSTGRGWGSCMTLKTSQSDEGTYAKYVSHDLAEGTFICYLISSDDLNIQRPFARILIKPFINMDDSSQIMFSPEKVYAIRTLAGLTGNFLQTVRDLIRDAHDVDHWGEYELASRLYCDTSQVITVSPKSLKRYESLMEMPTTIEEVKRRVDDMDRCGVFRGSLDTRYIKIEPDLSVTLPESGPLTIVFAGTASPFIDWAQIPIQFGLQSPLANENVHMSISDTLMASLRGCPPALGTLTVASNNRLQSLDGAPTSCKRLTLRDLPALTSLRGGPIQVRKYTTLTDLPSLQSLDGLPVTPSLMLNNLPNVKSLRGCPQRVEEFTLGHMSGLTSLAGSPRVIDTCYINAPHITTFKGGPQEVLTYCRMHISAVSFEGSPKPRSGTAAGFLFTPTLNLKSFKGLPSGENLSITLNFNETQIPFTMALPEFLDGVEQVLAGTMSSSSPGMSTPEGFISVWATFPTDIVLHELSLIGMPFHGFTNATQDRFRSLYPNIRQFRATVI